MFGLVVRAAQAGGGFAVEPDAAAMFALGVEALSELSRAGLDSEFVDAAAGGFAAGRVGLVALVAFVVGLVGAVVVASGGVEDFGLSPAETSSTGLLCKIRRKIFQTLQSFLCVLGLIVRFRTTLFKCSSNWTSWTVSSFYQHK